MSLAHYRDIAKRDLLRWGTCFVAILSLHGAVAAALLSAPQPEGDTLDAVTAIDVDFTTESFKDAQARDIAPGEEQQQTDAAPPPMEKAELKAEAEDRAGRAAAADPGRADAGAAAADRRRARSGAADRGAAGAEEGRREEGRCRKDPERRAAGGRGLGHHRADRCPPRAPRNW